MEETCSWRTLCYLHIYIFIHSVFDKEQVGAKLLWVAKLVLGVTEKPIQEVERSSCAQAEQLGASEP